MSSALLLEEVYCVFLKERDLTVDDKEPRRRFNLHYLLPATPLAIVSQVKNVGEQMNSFGWCSFIFIHLKRKDKKETMANVVNIIFLNEFSWIL